MLMKLGQYIWQNFEGGCKKQPVENCKGREKQTPKPINFILKIRRHSYYASGCVSSPYRV